jgi:tyrosinase
VSRVPIPTEGPIPGGPERELQADVVGATDRPARLIGDEERVRVPVEARARRDALTEGVPRQIVLNIENIEAERNPGTIYGVYVNLPADPTPRDLAAHHAGNVSLFGIERTLRPRGDNHAHGGMQVAIDITDLVETLAEQGEWTDEALNVTFRPISLEVADDAPGRESVIEEVQQATRHEDTPISVGRVSIQMR